MKTSRIGLLLGVSAMAFGCQSGQPNREYHGKYKLPPAPPKYQPTPIDPALRRSAEAEVARNFASKDAFVRANAVEATQRTLGIEGAPRLFAALTDPSPVVRFAGAMAVGTLKLPDAKDRLLTMVDDTDKSVQVAVRYALHRLGDTRLSHDFEIFAKDNDEHVRGNTAVALGLLGEPSAVNILNVMRRDMSVPVRLQAIEAMWRLGNTEARDKLVTGTVSKFPDDQIVCLLALAAPKNQDAMRYIRSQLTNDYTETKLAAARAAGMLGSDDGMRIALDAVKSSDARQRSMAALALGDIGRSDAQDELDRLLKDRDASVRLAAATAILQLKPPGSAYTSQN